MSPLEFTLPLTLSFLLCLGLTKFLIKYYNRHNRFVIDYHKPNNPKVAFPGGISLIASLCLSNFFLYLFTKDIRILAILLVTLIAGIVGIIDDFYILGGKVKPALTILASIPILLFSTYDIYLQFPLFGSTRLSIIYPLLIIISIPVTSNVVNSIDVFNGVLSSFMILASLPLLIALMLKAQFILVTSALILILSCFAFFIYHRYPSKIFPGDSGALALGASFGALAIVGDVEFVGLVALLPAIINSFFFLTSVKDFLEHRQLKKKPVRLNIDYELEALEDRDAPLSLVRMIVAEKPLKEKDIVKRILIISAYSSALAIVTAIIMYTKWV
ncbi:MAG: UDP-N-acetylglucosamine-1-phosphate transferase [Nitrososphaerales archaeon]